MESPYDHNTSLGYLTAVASRRLSNTLATRLQGEGIDMTSEQWGALLMLLNEGAMTQGQLGELLCLEKSSVSRLVNGLERRGWILRTRHPKDSRQKLISPTSKVQETAVRCATIARTILSEAQAGTTESEQAACQSFLLRIIENLNHMGK